LLPLVLPRGSSGFNRDRILGAKFLILLVGAQGLEPWTR
jgi:hypothetical protein